MINTENLRAVDPLALSAARSIAHRAVQHLTGLARANLPAKPDDSHSNLGWDAGRGALVTHDIDGVRMGLVVADMVFFIGGNNGMNQELELANRTIDEASAWTDEHAERLDLKAASLAEIPYEFPDDVASVESYAIKGMESQFAALAEWFGMGAAALEDVREPLTSYQPGPSPVRCWPHHFDIATYVALEEGDPETARGIGIGMAPGDGSYNQPYIYVNPWPHLDADNLGPAVAPGHWHTDGFVGLIATGSELVGTGDTENALAKFLDGSVASALKAQGIR